MKKLVAIGLILITLLMVFVPACSGGTQTTSPSVPASLSPTPSASASPSALPKVDTLRLVGTIGPLTIPLAYMQQNNLLASVANKTTLDIWATPTQLQAIIAGGQGDFVSLPTNSAATFYNKGVSLQMLDASIWNILFLVSSDPNIKSVTDLKGKKVVVPYQGAIPDAMFRYVLQKQGLNPDTDINIFYAPDPVQASQLLLTGQDQYCLLSEPSATQVILKAQSTSTPLYRDLNMQTEWQKASGGKSSTPIAGTVVLGAMKNRPDVLQAFLTQYQKAIQWMLANPVQAGQVGAGALSQQGFTADVLTESMKNIDWRFVSAGNARPDIESFFNALAQVSPNFIGGKLPDDAFYYTQSK
jgi:NitT/TauT family transport system substrate-binding protein